MEKKVGICDFEFLTTVRTNAQRCLHIASVELVGIWLNPYQLSIDEGLLVAEIFVRKSIWSGDGDENNCTKRQSTK